MRVASRIAVLSLAVVAAAAVPGVALADDVRAQQWYVDDMRLHDAHEMSQGEGIVVGLVSTGVDAEHPDLDGVVIDERAFGENPGSLDGTDDNGTAAASVLAGGVDGDGVLGVAPGAQIKSASVTPPQGDSEAHSHLISDAMEYLAAEGVDLIVVTATSPAEDARDAEDGDAVPNGQFVVDDIVAENDIPIVAAVGDHDGRTDTTPAHYPAAYDQVVSVVGTDAQGAVWGGSALPSEDSKLRVGAPAEEVPTAIAGGGHETRHGTAYAAAVAGGVHALVQARWPDLNWQETVEQVTRSGAVPVGGSENLRMVDFVKALDTDIEGHEPTALGEDAPIDTAAEADANTVLAAIVGVGGAVLLTAFVVGVRVYDRRKLAALAQRPAPQQSAGIGHHTHTPPGGLPKQSRHQAADRGSRS